MDITNMNLVSRKLFSHGDSNHTCPAADTNGPTLKPLIGSMTFHTFATMVSGAMAIVTVLLGFYLAIRHANHYSAPREQRQIIRIGFFVPWVGFFAFMCIWLEGAGEYLMPGIDCAASLALSSFLLLLCDFVLSNPDGFDELFGDGALARGQFAPTSPQWLKRTWYSVLQFIPVSIILWIATVISLAVGTYCATSNKPYFAHIWIVVIKSICEGLAILSILQFVKRMKTRLAPHKVILKLVAFKGVVGISFLQSTVISILVSSGVIKPTSHLSYNDIKVGLPNFLLCCEMPLFSVLILYAYRVSPYKNKKSGKAYQGGPGGIKALLQALNYTDILSAFVRGPMRLVRGQEKRLVREDSTNLIAPPSYNNTASSNNVAAAGQMETMDFEYRSGNYQNGGV